MAKSTTMLVFALMLVHFLLSNEEYEYEPGINVIIQIHCRVKLNNQEHIKNI